MGTERGHPTPSSSRQGHIFNNFTAQVLWETSPHPALSTPKTRARRIPASPEQRAAAENHPGAPSPASWEPGMARGASGGEGRGFLLQKNHPRRPLCSATPPPSPGCCGQRGAGRLERCSLIAGNDRMLAGKVPGKEVRAFLFYPSSPSSRAAAGTGAGRSL